MAGLWISIGLLVFAGIVAAGVLVAKGTSGQITEVKDKSVLYFDLSGVVSERYQPTNIFELIQSGQSGPSLTLDEMILSLQAAADDDRILGLYLDCNGAAMGPASREELLAAIGDFKEAGKWIIAYADSYTQSDYMLASTADTVSLNPVGCIDIHGAGGMTPFYKGLLEKLGVKVQIIKVGTFKSAVEPYILSQMSEPARLQMQQYIDSIWDYTAGAIADNRDIAVGEIKALAPQMLMAKSGDYFVENRLADNLLYRRQVDLYLKELCGLDSDEDLRLIAPSDYLSSGSKVFGKRTSGDHVAVYYAVGDISDSGKEGIVGSEVVNDIIDLADDDNVLGLVLRVNSPGGSAFASEQIWEALQYFKSKDKPLYVSMGDYAASGGYYISCGADTIFADRTTITG
ncbi:MAG: S49 family peptidase, partial [Muribaculaceae bacterium]|nr:S49 family peptidase [Muribaculaceae bacterium]